jgi:hypothetical protein
MAAAGKSRSAEPKGGAQLRRSVRVPLELSLLISGHDLAGAPFFAAGHTLTVNRYGARIFTTQQLVPGTTVRVTLPEAHRSRQARVVAISSEAENEYGIELDSGESFWGVEIPALRPKKESRPPSVRGGVAEGEGVEVLVSGMSAIRTPFQEKTLFTPLSPTTATVLVHPLVEMDVVMRILFDDGHRISGTVFASSQRRVGGRWKLWLRFDSPLA